jgi:hypothetical protein
MVVEKRLRYEDIKIRGKQNELRNIMKYVKYIAAAKTAIRYASYFVDFESRVLSN